MKPDKEITILAAPPTIRHIRCNCEQCREAAEIADALRERLREDEDYSL